MSGERPPIAADEVFDFVRRCHGDEEGVRGALAATPALARAAWDWGGGDFETALGAAAHTGQATIARLLLEHGAQLDLCAAAMLGERGVVEAHLSAYPAAAKSTGAHGIPVAAHALAGGQEEILGLLAAAGAEPPPPRTS